MSAHTGPGLLPQQGVIVGNVDTSERSNEPFYADAARAASGEKSSGNPLYIHCLSCGCEEFG